MLESSCGFRAKLYTGEHGGLRVYSRPAKHSRTVSAGALVRAAQSHFENRRDDRRRHSAPCLPASTAATIGTAPMSDRDGKLNVS
jgi:hypothetical protein